VAKVRNCIQAIAANKVTVGDRVLVLISGSVPSELRYLRHFKEEGECHRLALDPGLPIESFHALKGIWTKGQEPHRPGQRPKGGAGLPLEPFQSQTSTIRLKKLGQTWANYE
jgi:hypothetical protein